MPSRDGFATAACLALLLVWTASAQAEDAVTVDFGREVYPILQRACFECHNAEKREGGLRLDDREAFLEGGDSGDAVEPGDAEYSELVRRISLERDDYEVMPARGALLSQEEIALIRRWIDQGAQWPDNLQLAGHWAYESPVRPPLPAVKQANWPRTPIDSFILARLEREGLAPSPETDRYRLARRVYLDLIGLPPSPAEAEAFVHDTSPEAYERLVDRLLASPQFGERWARPWLDAARYADSHGFQRDDLRDLWPYRDWVIDALNRDMPFDQFTIEQLAGDLLPQATTAQRIATGFNRCAPTNCEAGSDPRETRVNQVFDRVNTLGMVWLGTTLECAQCHDHKYDPITARDYYGLFAFFNSTALEADRTDPKVPGSIQFQGPTMDLPNPQRDAQRAQLARQVRAIETQIAERRARLEAYDAEWEQATLQRAEQASREHVLKIAKFESLEGATHEILDDGSVLVSGEIPETDTYRFVVKTDLTNIRGLKLEALTHASLPGTGPGRGDEARPNFVLHTFAATLAPQGGGEAREISFTRATADFSGQGYEVEKAIDGNEKTGWAVHPEFHKSHWASFETAEPFGHAEGSVLTFRLVQQHGAGRVIGRLRISAITGQAEGDSVPEDVVQALAAEPAQRTAEQRTVLADYRQKEDRPYRKLAERKRQAQAKLKKLAPDTTLVMQELSTPRETFILDRGNFLTPGAAVAPRTPEALHPFRTDRPQPNRLDLARWLVDRENPLVARVTVNRWWAELFGHGLVTTPEDFGIKGDPPTHPALLDWLAVEFMDHGWSRKHILRTIVLSATYRQSAAATPELLARDDRNLLYARGPRFRLSAETIRDNALAIAGLIHLASGGPPIQPYQPEGIWQKVGGERYDYVVSPGAEKYRRGIYVVWKRGAPYPSFVNFDANNRMACRVKRPRSNTPLQALTLMNDPVYVEAAMAFARRVLTEKPQADDTARLMHAFQLALVRPPQPSELQTLRGLLEAQRAASQEDQDAARQFLGKFQLPEGVEPAEFVAWYAVAAALLNLDETITKG